MKDKIRSFIAINIPEELKAKISLLKKDLNIDGIKYVKEENLHITLKFLGDVANTKIAEIEKVLREIKFKNFTVCLHSVGVFPNENYIRIVWVGCESKALVELADKINNLLSGMFKKESFSAHLTIARVKRNVDFSEFLNKHKNENFGEFEVSSFELKMSELDREGPNYSTLAEFPATDSL